LGGLRSGNPAFVVMMQATDLPNFDDFAFVRSLCPSALWRSLPSDR